MWLLSSKQLAVRAASFLALASIIRFSTASPLSLVDENRSIPNATLAIRCENPCGWAAQLCCAGGQQCYTDSNNEAQCGGGATASAKATAGGYWQYYTTTWVATDLVTQTSVYSSYIPGPATVSATATWVPPAQATETGSAAQCGWDEISCGNICCTSQQYCLVAGQCAAAGGNSVSESPSAPLRVTSSGVVIVTNTIQPTTTVAFQSAVSTGSILPVTSTSTSGGLSGGAIAGIVIGVLLGLIILFLLCLCLCFGAAWQGLLAIFGLGKKRNKKTEVVEYEHYSRHGDSRRWYGDRPSRPERPPPPKKNNGIGWGGVAAGLGGLAVLLGMKRRYDRRQSSRRDEKESEYSSEYTYSEDFTVSDRTSSDGRTRDTRRSRSRR